MKAFGERLKALRLREEFGQTEFAALFNVKRQTLGSWEQGLTSPDVGTLFLIQEKILAETGSLVDLHELISGKPATEAASPLEVIIRLLQRIGTMGIQDIHSTRAEALMAFCPHIEREHSSICIVSSSFLGVTRVAPPRVGEILRNKAGSLQDFKILLTHPDSSAWREDQEARKKGSIKEEIRESVKLLLDWGVKPDNIRFYRGAPTIFLMFTPTRMLANPYTYRAEAFKTVTFELSPAQKAAGLPGGIYEQYFEHHFSTPFKDSDSLHEVKEFKPELDAQPRHKSRFEKTTSSPAKSAIK